MNRQLLEAALVLSLVSLLLCRDQSHAGSGAMPVDPSLQLRLQLKPAEDRLYVRAINKWPSVWPLDVASVSDASILLYALPKPDPSQKDESLRPPGGGGEGPLMVFGGGRPPEPFPVTTTVWLAHNQYIGCFQTLSDQPWLADARKALANAKDDKHAWIVTAQTRTVAKGPSGHLTPTYGFPALSNGVELTPQLLTAIHPVPRPEKPAASRSAVLFPFIAHMAISDDETHLQVEVVCEYPQSATFLDRKTVPAGANLDTSCANPAAIAWTLTAASHPKQAPLFQTKATPTTQPDPAVAAAPATLYLPPHRFLGTAIMIQKTPFFPSMQRFFDTSKDMNAACTLVARLRVRSPGLRPSDAASVETLSTPELRITREMFERIIAARE